MLHPFEIRRLSSDRPCWYATHPWVMTHGVGGTPEEALADFQDMLSDYFRGLWESKDVLAPHLQKELEYILAECPEWRDGPPL